jgi:hypothetical protein
MCSMFQGFSQPAFVGVPDRLAILVTMSDTTKGTGAGDMPTTQLRMPGAAPSAPKGNGNGSGRGGWSPGKRAAALLGVCAVAGGGTFLAVQATGAPAAQPAAQSVAAQSAAQAGTVASATDQAAVLQAAIATPNVHRLERLRRLGGMYGQFTYKTKEGARTLAFERGTIASVGGGAVVIRAADGTTYTWTLTSTSVVREDGTKEPVSTLAAGQPVFAGGLVTGGTRDARLVVIRKAAKTPKSSTSTST